MLRIIKNYLSHMNAVNMLFWFSSASSITLIYFMHPGVALCLLFALILAGEFSPFEFFSQSCLSKLFDFVLFFFFRVKWNDHHGSRKSAFFRYNLGELKKGGRQAAIDPLRYWSFNLIKRKGAVGSQNCRWVLRLKRSYRNLSPNWNLLKTRIAKWILGILLPHL